MHWYFMQIVETICMKHQSLFSGENKKEKYFKLLSAETFTQHAKH